VTELPIEKVLLETVSVIERLGIRYAVMGGFAAGAWGLPRPTFDAEIAVVVDEDSLMRLFDGLEREGFDVPAEHRTGFRDVVGGFEKVKVNRFLDRHVWRTDLFVVNGPFLTSALDRAKQVTIGRRHVQVMSPEDIILLKLIANRRKDQADIEEIIGLCKNLDVPYLNSWATKLELAERLRQFISFPS